MMYGRPNHTLITTMERAEGADEGPERSQARTKQRKPSQKVILVCLQHERLSTEVSRDTSRDMAGEVGRDPLLHRGGGWVNVNNDVWSIETRHEFGYAVFTSRFILSSPVKRAEHNPVSNIIYGVCRSFLVRVK